MTSTIQFEKGPIPFLKGGTIHVASNGIKVVHPLKKGETESRVTYHYGLGVEVCEGTCIEAGITIFPELRGVPVPPELVARYGTNMMGAKTVRGSSITTFSF